ncbi:MAG: hypothetical protein NT076_04985 [Candidatus Pacearchaeota archaeon]|nr:hypothetical protein [Candidatus Pacearchaeota archaeon]
MKFKERYIRTKNNLLTGDLCKENKELFTKFFDWQELKLKRTNGLAQLDDPCYNTLCCYISRFKNVNLWFNNKPWIHLTKEDIKKVYDDLEDGKIKTKRGERFGDLKSYYGKMFRSKPFEMAGKSEIVKEVMEFTRCHNKEDVRFIEEETFRKIIDAVLRLDQKLLCWIAFDIGENVNTIIRLKKSDVFRQINPNTKEPEYMVNLPKDKLKRTRLTRSEITNFKETTELFDLILKDLKDDEQIFKFEYAQSKKFLNRAVGIVKAKCIPKGQNVTWKDLRSSMACHLLKNHWTTDEVNARLGHKPSSKEIDKYCNFLAIGRHEPKKKMYYNNLQKVEDDLEETKQNLKLTGERMRKQSDDILGLKVDNIELKKQLMNMTTGYKESLIQMKKFIFMQQEMHAIKN